jgi:hypothetical protein
MSVEHQVLGAFFTLEAVDIHRSLAFFQDLMLLKPFDLEAVSEIVNDLESLLDKPICEEVLID